jgi:signal peptidase II
MRRSLIKYGFVLLFLLGGYGADLKTKQWAYSTLKDKPAFYIFYSILEFGYVENRGMIFGILNDSGAHPLKSVLLPLRGAILVFLSIFIIYIRRRPFLFLLPFLLIWVGALGNITDHFKYGHVVDLIHMRAGPWLDWPFFFNLADAYGVIGVVLIFLQSRQARSPLKNLPRTK